MTSLPDRIYFTGFMAAGKTTIGRMVANTLGFDFVDIDEQIENLTGQTVSELFKQEGEVAFRARELAVLAEVSQWKEHVVSLGGGALSTPGAWERLGSNRLVIYIRVPVPILVRRIQRARYLRPLMADSKGRVLPKAELTAKVTEMLSQREPQYLQADIIYDGSTRSVGVTVDRIVNLIRRAGRQRGSSVGN